MAHVMNPAMGRIPAGPYSDNAYIPTSTHGWVHANTWYASAPFNSAPPPAPAGINPQTWANGHWQPNPYFRPPQGAVTQPPNQFQMWAPHPGWGAGAQTWNPYKRKPNPGDASYWATELSDNPLMLENMHIKDDTPAEERHRKDSSNGVPHTPWVWVPKELSSDTSKSAESTGTSGPRDGQNGQRQHEQSEKVLPAAPQAQRRDYPHDHSRANSSSRNAYAPPATAHETSSQSRHYQYDASRTAPPSQDRAVPSSAPAGMSTFSAYHQQQQQLQQQQRQQQYQQEPQRASDRYYASSQQQQQQQQPDASQHHQRQQSRNVSPRQTHDSQAYSTRDYRSGPTTSASSSASAAAAAARQSSTDSTASSSTTSEYERRRDEAFSAKRDLLPTFSPNIVRTPDHYHSTARLAGSADPERTPTRYTTAPPSHGPIYAPANPTNPPTRSNSLNAGRQGSQSSVASSASANSGLGLISFTEEPDSVLSPLVVPGETPASSTRPSPRHEVGRSHTYPTVMFAMEHPGEERDHPVFRKTPRDYSRTLPGDGRDYDRSRDVDATPQPGTRTPPAHTPPLSHYTRPSPDNRSAAQPISRSHTYPAAVIPPPPITPQRSRSPPRYSPKQPQSQSQSQSTYSSPYSHSHSSSASYARTSPNPPSSSVTSASPLRHNPLPRPPQASPYAEQLTRGSSSASASAAAVAAQSQQAQRRQVRYGFWNRRGDHLYVSEKGERFIVYAPRHLANPEDLKHYPSPTEGWQDHHGKFVRYDPSVPELPDSLPVHGEPPRRPYQNFVQYVAV